MVWWREFKKWLSGASLPDHVGDADLPACRAATWEDVLMVTGLLEQHAAKYVLVGGYALMVNGIVRQTGDVDVLVENSVENNAKWIAAMAELPDREAAVLIGEDDPFPKEDGPYGNDEGPCVLRIADVIVVDVMPRACGLTFAQLEENIVRVDVGDGHEISVLDLYGLWLTKQAPRDKDRADKAQIEYALTQLQAWPADHEARLVSIRKTMEAKNTSSFEP